MKENGKIPQIVGDDTVTVHLHYHSLKSKIHVSFYLYLLMDEVITQQINITVS